MARTPDTSPVHARVLRFLCECWGREHARELAAKAEVQAQTSGCAYQVNVPLGAARQGVYFGFVHTHWRDTVRCLEEMGVPAALPFPDAESFAAVTQADVQALEVRLQSDVALRLRLLQELARRSSVTGKRARFGQQWLREFLLRTNWPLPCPIVLSDDEGEGEGVGAHGVVESLFIRAAASVPADKWEFVFVCMLAFVAQSVDGGRFVPLPPAAPLADEEARGELATWLLHYYDDWADRSGEFEQSLARLSRAWRRHYSSVPQFRATLPPTTCYSFAVFECAVSAAAGVVPSPALQPPPATSAPLPETRSPAVRMTVQSSLFAPRYLREAMQETYL